MRIITTKLLADRLAESMSKAKTEEQQRRLNLLFEGIDQGRKEMRADIEYKTSNEYQEAYAKYLKKLQIEKPWENRNGKIHRTNRVGFLDLMTSDEKTNHNFSTCITSSPTETKIVNGFKSFVNNFEQIQNVGKGSGILMIGNVGTGKTFLSNCIVNELKAKDKIAIKTSLSHILECLRPNEEQGQKCSIGTLKEALKSCDLIVFDDLGNERLTDWGKEILFEVFNHLYNEKIAMVINTNLDGEQLSEFLKINGSDKIADRIASVCKRSVFDWASKRIDKNAEAFKMY